MGKGDRGRHRAHHHHRHHHAAHHHHHHAGVHHHNIHRNRHRFWHRHHHSGGIGGDGLYIGGGGTPANVMCMGSVCLIMFGAFFCFPGIILTSMSWGGAGSVMGPIFLTLGVLMVITGVAMMYMTYNRAQQGATMTVVGSQPGQTAVPVPVGPVQAGAIPNQPAGTYPPQPMPYPPGSYAAYPPNANIPPPQTGQYPTTQHYPATTAPMPPQGIHYDPTHPSYPPYPSVGSGITPEGGYNDQVNPGYPAASAPMPPYGFQPGTTVDSSLPPPPTYDQVINIS